MLPVALVLTAAVVLLELALVYRFDGLLELLRKRVLVGVTFSICLSWMVGMAFGAAGMIVMFAAVVSTVVTAFIYATGLLNVVKRMARRLPRREGAQ